MSSKVFIVTGASRGLGLAVVQALLKASHKVFLVARTEGELQKLKAQNPASVEFMAADLSDLTVAPKIAASTVEAFGKIDGLIINHGTLSPITKIFEASAEDWRQAYDINVFSAVALVKETLPELRKSSGRVVFVSSGAAFNPYAGWSCYGTSKSALTHLNSHLAVEEPNVTSVAISPGKVDTDMQKLIREEGQTGMSPDVHASFVDEHGSGRLLRPDQPGSVIAKLADAATKEHTGKHFKWNAPELAEFQ